MDIKDAVSAITKKVDAGVAEHKEAADVLQKEFKSVKDNFEGQVKTLNEELSKKDATLGEIRDEIKELKAKQGRLKGESPRRSNRLPTRVLRREEATIEPSRSG